ncbi:MAG TPA: hypothetical protein VL354_17475, partial [Spirochaetia bacterium]|nr:hypothetical protein [Spirochaetia bacterium]
MQLFSIGNLITFFAVLLILVILRALDRNNRSLEKLKRFSDKIAANISALAEEKVAQIHELIVGLQESLTSGKELMATERAVEESLHAKVRAVEDSLETQTRAVEESLQTSTAEAEGIRRRLLDYEKSFTELASVSSRLDQVVKKLREESEVSDSVAKKIGEAAARLEK